MYFFMMFTIMMATVHKKSKKSHERKQKLYLHYYIIYINDQYKIVYSKFLQSSHFKQIILLVIFHQYKSILYIIPLKQSCNHVELTNFFKKYIIQENTTLLYIKFNFVYQLLFTKHKKSLVIQLYSKVQSYNNILFFLQFFWYKHSLYKHNTCHKCHKENRG